MPRVEGLIQGGYNDLANAYNKFRNYKFVLSGEDRYSRTDSVCSLNSIWSGKT